MSLYEYQKFIGLLMSCKLSGCTDAWCGERGECRVKGAARLAPVVWVTKVSCMQACTLVLMYGLFNLVCIHKWALRWGYADVVW